jgi:hypothetical protein
MEIKGSLYNLNIQERKNLKFLIDNKYGKISTPIDYESTGEYSEGLEYEILQSTGERISGSTLERLVGLRSEAGAVRKSTLLIVAKYLRYSSLDALIRKLKLSGNTKTAKIFEISDLFKIHIIKIEYGNNKAISVRFIADKSFEVVASKNTKFTPKDIIVIDKLEVDYCFECNSVKRIINAKETELGSYSSNYYNKVNLISFHK